MPTYTKVLSRPGVIRIVASQLAARFPFGMMTLVFVLHIHEKTGSYAIAGLAVGLETLGVAISGPVLSRWMVTLGVRRLLLTVSSITSLAILAIGVIPMPAIGMIALCFLVGLSSPPIQPAVRTIYPTLVDKRGMGTLYSLDASLQEIIWVLGPVAATFIAAGGSTEAGVIVMAVIQIVGALWFCANPEVAKLKLPKPSRRLGGVLRQKLIVANAVIGGLLVGSFSGVEVGTVALFERSTAGFVIAALSLGSLIGGFAFGHLAKTQYALTKLLALITFGYGLAFIAPDNSLWLAAVWFVAGLGVAPALGLLGAIIGASVKSQDAPEAYGWVGTGHSIGFAAGAAVTGFVIEALNPASALLVAVVCSAMAAGVAWYSASFTPVISRHGEEEI